MTVWLSSKATFLPITANSPQSTRHLIARISKSRVATNKVVDSDCVDSRWPKKQKKRSRVFFFGMRVHSLVVGRCRCWQMHYPVVDRFMQFTAAVCSGGEVIFRTIDGWLHRFEYALLCRRRLGYIKETCGAGSSKRS